jgi:hypothetical protein
MPKRYPNNKILVFADTHAPFHAPEVLEFLEEVKKEHQPDRVIHNGDLSDSYWFSMFTKDIIAGSMRQELTELREFVKDLHEIFPDMLITESNHDARMWRKATQAGIPREMLIPYKTMIGAKGFKGWKLVDDVTLTVDATRQQVYVAHVKTGGPLRASRNLGMSVVMSHHHNSHGVQYWSNGKQRFFGVDTGCLIDPKAYAFAYSKTNIGKPTRGCVIIDKGVPQIIPMD